MRRDPVAITGWGCVSCFGAGKVNLEEALATSAIRLSEVDRSFGYHAPRSAQRAALVPSDCLKELVPNREARRMSHFSRLAVAAARFALADAERLPEDGGDPRGAVVLATDLGPTAYTERLLEQIFHEGRLCVSPALFTESVANAPAAQVALRLGSRGPNVTITQRGAGGLTAVARAALLVSSGAADWALAGACDEVSPLQHAALDRFRALARPDASGKEVARPLDRDRRGFILGEGATVLVLERESAALERGRDVLARVVASGSAFEPSAPTHGWAESSGGAAGRLRQRLGQELDGVDCVVSGASGARPGDRYEAGLIRALFPSAEVPTVLAPKSQVGSWSGASLGPALVAAQGAVIGRTVGFEQADSDLSIEPFDGSLWQPPSRILLTESAAGGSVAALVLEAEGGG